MAHKFKEFWMSKSHVSKVIFILIVLYCIASINVLFLSLGMVPYFQSFQQSSYLLIGFAISSFALTLFMSAYHLSTMLRRRKRKSDRLSDEGKLYRNQDSGR
jgi:putative effector of murein hydrolase LrgA (UPF0299 family)